MEIQSILDKYTPVNINSLNIEKDVLDIEKDIREYGLFILPDDKDVGFLGLISGSGSSRIAEYNRSVSVMFMAMAPALSRVLEIGKIPSCDKTPAGGFSPQMPFPQAHAVMEWQVSVPTAIGTMPAATATAEPVEDPSGLSSLFTACITCPPREL